MFEVGHKVICQGSDHRMVRYVHTSFKLCFFFVFEALLVLIFVFVVFRYPWIISAVNPNGTYNVDYDDGDEERDQLKRPGGVEDEN